MNWDLDLLEGYSYVWAENIAANPGSHHFKGIITPGLIPQVAEYQPDALLVFGWAYHSHLEAIRYFHRHAPVYFRGDSTLLDERAGIKSLVKTILLRWIYRHIGAVFYPGGNSRQYFLRFGIEESRLIFAPHAIDNDRFTVSDHAGAEALRDHFGIKPHEILVLYAGSSRKKRRHVIVKHFSQTGQTGNTFVICRQRQLAGALKSAAAGNNHIDFLDFRNQTAMRVTYQAADLFCLPSKGPRESLGTGGQ